MKFTQLIKRSSRQSKILVIGLDCAAPELVFERWKQDLPNLNRLASLGWWGELESTIPAITVPAWSSMLSSKDPGTLGIYGFRNRATHGYENYQIATSSQVKHKRVWDYLGEAGMTSVIVGVPQTYPVKPLNGCLVSDFLTPSIQNEFAYPPSLKDEILNLSPDYDFDVKQFRTEDKEWLLKQIYQMTEKHNKVVEYLLSNKPWNFFMLVEIGVDRIHHGFWSLYDPLHFRFQPENPFQNAIHDYYVFLDKKIGEWVSRAGKDTVLLVVSDHGARRMEGGICVNEWLWKNGYLFFKDDIQLGQVKRFDELQVDWSRTIAWGDGGYYGRVFMNVQGREPQGQLPKERYESVREELRQKLIAIPDPAGKDIGTKIYKPEEIYREVNGVAPDLIVYWGNLSWRSVGSVGYGSFHTFENDTGPDDCNHAQNGMVILYDPAHPGRGKMISGANILDIAPTILDRFGIKPPDEMQGKLLVKI